MNDLFCKTYHVKQGRKSVLPLSNEGSSMKTSKFCLVLGFAMWSTCVFAQDGYMGGDQMDSGNMGGYGNMMNSGSGVIIMGIMGVLVLVVLVVLVYFLLKRSGTGVFGSTSKETPLDILKKRYSRGEITKARFEEMKKDL